MSNLSDPEKKMEYLQMKGYTVEIILILLLVATFLVGIVLYVIDFWLYMDIQ
jgi:phage shock protein PspC (stress-responsive transcriptional regulator)